MYQQRRHQNASIETLIRQMLHSQHKESTDQGDGTTVKEWREELELRIMSLLSVIQTAEKIIEEFPHDDQDVEALRATLILSDYKDADMRWLEAEREKRMKDLTNRQSLEN